MGSSSSRTRIADSSALAAPINELLIQFAIVSGANAFIVYPREDAVGMELRLRYWHHFEGTVYWDDVFIAPVPDLIAEMPEANLLSNGGFEAETPAYWTPDGSGAEWSAEASRTPSYSLKLSGTGAASWAQPGAARGTGMISRG